jgi:hypothetical protein
MKTLIIFGSITFLTMEQDGEELATIHRVDNIISTEVSQKEVLRHAEFMIDSTRKEGIIYDSYLIPSQYEGTIFYNPDN